MQQPERKTDSTFNADARGTDDDAPGDVQQADLDRFTDDGNPHTPEER